MSPTGHQRPKLCLLPLQMVSGQILVGSLDCQRFQTFCQSQGVRAYPEVRLYAGSTKQPDRYASVPRQMEVRVSRIFYQHLVLSAGPTAAGAETPKR